MCISIINMDNIIWVPQVPINVQRHQDYKSQEFNFEHVDIQLEDVEKDAIDEWQDMWGHF